MLGGSPKVQLAAAQSQALHLWTVLCLFLPVFCPSGVQQWYDSYLRLLHQSPGWYWRLEVIRGVETTQYAATTTQPLLLLLLRGSEHILSGGRVARAEREKSIENEDCNFFFSSPRSEEASVDRTQSPVVASMTIARKCLFKFEKFSNSVLSVVFRIESAYISGYLSFSYSGGAVVPGPQRAFYSR